MRFYQSYRENTAPVALISTKNGHLDSPPRLLLSCVAIMPTKGELTAVNFWDPRIILVIGLDTVTAS
jgi:hypothetical protein